MKLGGDMMIYYYDIGYAGYCCVVYPEPKMHKKCEKVGLEFAVSP